MKFPTKMFYCIILHKEKTVLAYARKLDAIYKHIQYRRGDRVEFKEYVETKLISLDKYYKVKKYD